MLQFKEGVVLSSHTTLKVGGEAQYFVRVESLQDLIGALSFAREHTLSLAVLGSGSNVLVGDEGFPGLVIQVGLIGRVYQDVSDNEVHLTVGAGELLDDVVKETVEKGYWGIENLSHIPGTVGAAPIQNVGAYGVEIGEVVVAVEALSLKDGKVERFSAAACHFGYRDSFFKTETGRSYIITSVTLALRKQAQPKVTYADLAVLFENKKGLKAQTVREAIIAIRSGKFPNWHIVGTAGSFFKNPIITKLEGERLRIRYPELPLYEINTDQFKCPLGYILDKICKLKGYREGLVRLYEAQALVLVAERGATAAMIESFVLHITEKVFFATGIVVEWEVTRLMDAQKLFQKNKK